MIQRIGWAVWAVLPVVGLAYHFGPGQIELRRDEAAHEVVTARDREQQAADAQAEAHATQLERLAADKAVFLKDSDANRKRAEQARAAEKAAYAAASAAWKRAADAYQVVEELLGDSREAREVRWAKGRALVRAGEIWNGIDEFESILAVAEGEDHPDPELATAARDELAVANYYGARLLRDEGRPAKEWRPVSALARQQYRYLAERAAAHGDTELADALQRNLERVLDLEQLDSADLVAMPLPKDSPAARSGNDRGPPKDGGRGPTRRGPPGNGAGAPLDIGPGW